MMIDMQHNLLKLTECTREPVKSLAMRLEPPSWFGVKLKPAGSWCTYCLAAAAALPARICLCMRASCVACWTKAPLLRSEEHRAWSSGSVFLQHSALELDWS